MAVVFDEALRFRRSQRRHQLLHGGRLRVIDARAILQSPKKVGEYLSTRLGHLDYEIFGLILVDQRHRVIECIDLFRGTLSGASVHPREVVELALLKGAAACLAYHNHPSGVQDQSQADELITQRLREALALVDVRLIDHILGGFCSVTTAFKTHQ